LQEKIHIAKVAYNLNSLCHQMGTRLLSTTNSFFLLFPLHAHKNYPSDCTENSQKIAQKGTVVSVQCDPRMSGVAT
jgi:hypothetical protein